jgi:hypothetical protein
VSIVRATDWPFQKKNEKYRRSRLALENELKTLMLLSLSWCISWHIKIDRERTDRPQRRRTRQKGVTACNTKQARLISKKQTVSTRQSKTRQNKRV